MSLLQRLPKMFRNWRYLPSRWLVKKLKSESAEVRSYAAEALGEVGDAHAVELLIEALQDVEGTVRRFATSSLGNLGDPPRC